MMHKQRGMTLIGWVLVLGLIAFFALLAMRLVPMYQEYYAVLRILDSMSTELENNDLSKEQTKSLLVNKFNVGYIYGVKIKENVKILRGQNSPYIKKIVIDYEVRKPFIAQISLVGHFHEEIDVEQHK